MKISTVIRSLAAASLIAVAAATAAASPAGAREILCSATGATLHPASNLDWEFFGAGELVTMRRPNGSLALMQCGGDGHWRDRTLPRGPRGPRGGGG